MERGSTVEEKNLKLLRVVSMATAVSVIIISLIMSFMSQGVVGHGLNTVDVLRLEGKRAELQQSVVTYTSQLQLCVNGLQSRQNFTVVNGLLADAIADLTSVNQQLTVDYPPVSDDHVRTCPTSVLPLCCDCCWTWSFHPLPLNFAAADVHVQCETLPDDTPVQRPRHCRKPNIC